MNKKFLLILFAVCNLGVINGLDKEEIGNFAKQYVVLKRLKQNQVNIQLIIAARMRKDKSFFVNLVKNQGAQINAIDLQGRTALIHAVILNDYQTALALLEIGANSAIKDSFGKNALEYAYENNDTRIIKLLQSFEKLKSLE